jgi:hypothetical protein
MHFMSRRIGSRSTAAELTPRERAPLQSRRASQRDPDDHPSASALPPLSGDKEPMAHAQIENVCALIEEFT